MNNKTTNENKEQLRNVSKNAAVFADSLCDPILGKHFSLPMRVAGEYKVQLDTSLSFIPVYTHLKISDTEMLKRPATPPAIRRIENEEYMDFYVASKPQNSKTTVAKKDENSVNIKLNTKF